MNTRGLATLAFLTLAAFYFVGTDSGTTRAQEKTDAKQGDVSGVSYDIRVVATLKDTEQQKESRNPGQYEQKLVGRLRLFKEYRVRPWSDKAPETSNTKDPGKEWPVITRYRISAGEGKAERDGYYGIDIISASTPRLLELKPEATPFKKVDRDAKQEKVLVGELAEAELWKRTIKSKDAEVTEVLLRCLRGNVVLELVASHADAQRAESNARERFKLFFDNAVANQLFAGEEDYWKWFVRFGNLCQQNVQEIGCITATLGVKAEERRRLLKRWQELMQMENEAWPPDEGWSYEYAVLKGHEARVGAREFFLGDFRHKDPPLPPLTPTLNLAKMKAARDRVARPYKALYAEQADLIAEAQRHMQAIVTSIEQQWQLAQKSPKYATRAVKEHLEMSYRYWKDQQSLLTMRLYEAARWYKPEQFAKVVEELQLTSEADAEIAKLIKAKLLLGSIDDLERKIWLQRISPAYFRTGKQTRLDRSDTTFVSLREPADLEEHPVVFLTLPKGFEVRISQVEKDAQKARLDLVAALHEILKDNPKNVEARQMLLQQEFTILNWIAGKMESERQASWAAFQKFFTNRGYGDYSPQKLPQEIKETAWILWSNPWSTAGHAIAGTPDGLADAISTDEENAAAYFVTLNVLRRLSRRGLLLSEMRGLKAEEFGQHMVLHVEGKEDKQVDNARWLRKDMVVAFNDKALGLGDLAAGNGDAFLTRFNQTYFDVFDPQLSWAESIGEFCLSPQALLFTVGPALRPMWRLPKGTKAWTWLPAEVEAQYKTIGQLTIHGLKMTGLFERLKDTRLAEWVARDLEFIGGLRTPEWLVRVAGGRAAAACGLYVGLTQVTEEYDLPRTRLLVHCLFQLQATNLAYDILAASRAPTGPVQQAIAQLRKEVAEESQKLETLLATDARVGSLKESEDLVKSLAEATNETERANLRNKLATAPVAREGAEIARNVDKTIKPTGTDSAADLRWATSRYSEALADGDVAEMQKISKTMREISQRTKSELDVLAEEANAAAKLLNNAPPAARQVPTTAPTNLGDRGTYYTPDGRTKFTFFQTQEFYEKPGGELLLMADQMMHKGDFSNAAKTYDRSIKRAEKMGEDEVATLARQKHADAVVAESAEQIKLAARKATAKAPKPPAKPSDLFTDAELKALQDNPVYITSITTEVFVLKSGDRKYVFKIFNSDAAGIRHLAEKEAREEFTNSILDGCIASALARDVSTFAEQKGKDLGVLASAATRIKLKFTTDRGRVVEEVGVLTRYFGGKPLVASTFGEAAVFQKERARLRVFRALVGDPDGHGGNELINAATGEMLAIDFENARFADNLQHRLFDPRDKFAEGQANDFVKAVLDNVNNGARGRSPLYHSVNRMDELLNFEDMKDFIELIEKRYQGPEGTGRLEELIREGYKLWDKDTVVPKGDMEAKVKVIQDRIQYLYGRLKLKFEAIPKRTSRQVPRDDGRALCRAAEPIRRLAA